MKRLFIALSALLITAFANSQIVNPVPYLTLKCNKFPVMDVAISPRGDVIAVALQEYAEVYDTEKGKRKFVLKHETGTGQKKVNYIAFNENGEFIVTIDSKGRIKVWNSRNGKEEKNQAPHRSWIPKPSAIKAMGLAATNNDFDKYYTQSQSDHPKNKDIVAKSMENATINFENTSDGALEQELPVPETNDKTFRCPVYFNKYGDIFVTGNDQGMVYLHKVNPKGRY